MSTADASYLSDWAQQLGLECLLRHDSRPWLFRNIGRAEHTNFHLREAWPFSDQPGAGGTPLDPMYSRQRGGVDGRRSRRVDSYLTVAAQTRTLTGAQTSSRRPVFPERA